MIIRKTWERLAYDRKGIGGHNRSRNYLDIYTGWFLFGIFPLYISRDRKRR
jgi:hypothetical protein